MLRNYEDSVTIFMGMKRIRGTLILEKKVDVNFVNRRVINHYGGMGDIVKYPPNVFGMILQTRWVKCLF